MSFCQQLEQSQKEASDLLEQNRLLQDQLRVALGREQSAREGYVLQVGWRGCCGPWCAQELQCEGFMLRQARSVQNLAQQGPPPGSSHPWALLPQDWTLNVLGPGGVVFPPGMTFWGISLKPLYLRTFFGNKIIVVPFPFDSESSQCTFIMNTIHLHVISHGFHYSNIGPVVQIEDIESHSKSGACLQPTASQ